MLVEVLLYRHYLIMIIIIICGYKLNCLLRIKWQVTDDIDLVEEINNG